MAKIQIKSEKLTPFGGIFSIMEQFGRRGNPRRIPPAPKFLLEMGKGFLFEARQKRFTFDEDNYYVDLVLYNRLLQCYVLIDLKIDKLTHQDLGQMQMYVNYFDRYVKQDFEKPTIGILLCKEKNDALVEPTLPKDANVYAAAYQLYLPDKALLQAKVKKWIEEFEENEEIKKLEKD